jgi:hypothetical protein
LCNWENSPNLPENSPGNQGEFSRISPLLLMPYLIDPRRTVTLNLDPDEYADLAEDALQAGYASAGTYAKVLVLHRGEAPPPIMDRRSDERYARLEGQTEWSLRQFEALREQLQALGHAPVLAPFPAGEISPRSRPAQDRAVAAAVAAATTRAATKLARLQAKYDALVARVGEVGNP